MTKRSLKKFLVSSVTAVLSGALLMTSGFAAPEMSYSILNSSKTENTITANVTTYFKETIASGTVYSAIYNADGSLKSVDAHNAANAKSKTFQITVPNDKTSYSASFFLWDGTTIVPLANKKALAESDKPSYDVPSFNQDNYGARFAFEGSTLSDRVSSLSTLLTVSTTDETSYTGNKALKIVLKDGATYNGGSTLLKITAGTLPSSAKKLTLKFKVKIPAAPTGTGGKMTVSAAVNNIKTSSSETNFKFGNTGSASCNVQTSDWTNYEGTMDLTASNITTPDGELDIRIRNTTANIPIVYIDDIVLRAVGADGNEIAGYGFDDQNPTYPEKMTDDGTYKAHYSLENSVLPTIGNGFEFVNLNGVLSNEYSYDGKQSLKATVTNKGVFQIKLNKLAEYINAMENDKKPSKIKITLKLRGGTADRTQFCVEGYMPYASSSIAGYNNIKHTGGNATFITNDTNWHTYTAEWNISDVDFTTRAKTAAGDDRTGEPRLTFKMTDGTERTLYIDDIRIETGASGTLYDDNIVTAAE